MLSVTNKHSSKSFNLTEGLTHTLSMRVTEADIADTLGTAKVRVMSTSTLIRFMEKTVFELVKDRIPQGFASVSVEINIKHLKPIKKETLLRCNVHLKYIDNNKLFFDVAVLDQNKEQVALGAHERRIVNLDEKAGRWV